MTIEIVDFPMKHGDLNHSYVNVYQAGYTLQPFDRLTSKDLYVGFAWIVQPSLMKPEYTPLSCDTMKE